MAHLNAAVAKMSKGFHFADKEISNEMIVDANTSSIAREDLQCFVCDAKVQGRHYALATCRTQSTRTRVIEKLGELVGERYVLFFLFSQNFKKSFFFAFVCNLNNFVSRLHL